MGTRIGTREVNPEEAAAHIADTYSSMEIIPPDSRAQAPELICRGLKHLLNVAPYVLDPVVPVRLTREYDFETLVEHIKNHKGPTGHPLGRLIDDGIWHERPLSEFNEGTDGGLVAGAELEEDQVIVVHGMLPCIGEERDNGRTPTELSLDGQKGFDMDQISQQIIEDALRFFDESYRDDGLVPTKMSRNERKAVEDYIKDYIKEHPGIRVDPLIPTDALLADAVRRTVGERMRASRTFRVTIFPQFMGELSHEGYTMGLAARGSGDNETHELIAVPPTPHQAKGRRYAVSLENPSNT